MTEAEWRENKDPTSMLEFVRDKASERKLRLFACACCRRVWHLITDERSQKAVEVAERFADGLATEEERKQGAQAAEYPRNDRWKAVSGGVTSVPHAANATAGTIGAAFDATAAAEVAVEAVNAAVSHAYLTSSDIPAAPYDPYAQFAEEAVCNSARSAEQVKQSALIRDVVGNPFRPVTADSSWLTPKVVKLAKTIYAERAFDRMPELADALEQAICTNQNILQHCRQQGEHVRGCWVVDLILGKE